MYSCLHGKHRGTWHISAYQRPTSQHGSIFDSLLGIFGGSATPAQHTRFMAGPSLWDLSTRELERSGPLQRQLQTSAEDELIYAVLKHLAYYRCFRTIRSIQTTKWLTYLITWKKSNIRTLDHCQSRTQAPASPSQLWGPRQSPLSPTDVAVCIHLWPSGAH